MRGTGSISSVLRLFVCAAFLCLAWVLFSSVRADAAERPAPASAAALIASVEKPVSTTSDRVDAAAQSLKAVGAAVPALEAPVVVVADAVVTVSDTVPVVGRDPLVDVPLPDLSKAPLPKKLPVFHVPDPEVAIQAADSPATQGNRPSPTRPATVPRGLALASFDSKTTGTGVRSAIVAIGATPLSTGPEPSEPPGPFPAPQSPMPPTSSAPNPGGGTSSEELASIDSAIVLPAFTPRGSSASDWRAPRGLPAQPGSRPD